MKKFLAVIFAASAFGAYAQLGVQVGYVYSPSSGNLTLGTFNEFSGTARCNGFQAGVSYDFSVQGDLGMQVGLQYAYAAGTSREQGRTIMGIQGIQSTTSTYQFLNLPVRVSYSLPVTNHFKFFFFAGPVFSYGISARSKSQIAGVRLLGEYNNIYKDPLFKDVISPFNLEAGGGLGVLYNHFRLSIGYDQGILNLYNGNLSKSKLRRSMLGISVGYVF